MKHLLFFLPVVVAQSPVFVTIVNHVPSTVDVSWVGPQGEVPMFELLPSELKSMDSIGGHRFEVKQRDCKSCSVVIIELSHSADQRKWYSF